MEHPSQKQITVNDIIFFSTEGIEPAKVGKEVIMSSAAIILLIVWIKPNNNTRRRSAIFGVAFILKNISTRQFSLNIPKSRRQQIDETEGHY